MVEVRGRLDLDDDSCFRIVEYRCCGCCCNWFADDDDGEEDGCDLGASGGVLIPCHRSFSNSSLVCSDCDKIDAHKSNSCSV